MDRSLFDKYRKEMLEMYNRRTVKAVSQNIASNGSIIAIVTAFKELYPVENAKVTIFTGNMDNIQVLQEVYTDLSGRTTKIDLTTPPKSLSLDSQNKEKAYAVYNMMVTADGYLDNIHLNIPVFSGVTSLQRADLTPLSVAGDNREPQIFDESENYNL